MMKHGGQILVDALEAQGVTRVFCVPGESYLAALDGLYEAEIDTVLARQEGGAAMMAEAHGKLTGALGVAFVTRGPGATNASAGMHVAHQDSTPMVLFIGQVASDQVDREASQEVDYRQMFGPLAKWVAQIDRLDRIPEYVSQAFHVAQSGRPGPVVLALPEDMLSGQGEAAPAGKAVLPSGRASEADVSAVAEALAGAERPLVLLGGGGWSAEAAEAVARLAETADVPVAATFRCQDHMDNRHAHYVGDVGIGVRPDLAEAVREADVLCVIGARMGEMTTSGYTLLDIPQPKQRLVHIYPDASELGRVYRPELGVVAKPAVFVQQLAEAVAGGERGNFVTELRSAYEAWQQPEETPGDLKMEQVIAHLNAELGDDAILCNGAGNYAGWLHRYYSFRGWKTQLAPTSGSMGYGLPAAVAAKLERPGSEVVCLAGDGCYQMVMQEFGTAAQYGANIIVLVCDNGMYGTIRMHQEKHYPQRPSGTQLKNPDFGAIARAYGAFGAQAQTQAEFEAAFAEARGAGTPALIHLKIDPRALSTKLVLDRP